MRPTRRSVRHRSRGQTLVEFALLLPIIVMMIFLLIDGVRLVFGYSTLANATREGTRIAIVNQSVTGIENTIASSGVMLGLTASNVDYIGYKIPEDTRLGSSTPQDATDCAPNAPGCVAVIRTHFDYQPITPVVGSLFGTNGVFGPVTIATTAMMPVERAFTNP